MGLLSLFKKNKEKDLEGRSFGLKSEVAYQKLAIEMCLDLICNAMAKVEYKTYEKGKNKKESLYYLLNIKPNSKQNATQFYSKVVRKLLLENKAVLIDVGKDELFLADSYTIEQQAIKGDIYRDVHIDNKSIRDNSVNQYVNPQSEGVILNGPYKEQDIIVLNLEDSEIKKCIDNFVTSYSHLVSSSINAYKRKNAMRVTVSGDFFGRVDNKQVEKSNKQMTSQFKPWFEADKSGSAFLLKNNYKIADYSNKGTNDSKDTRDLIDSIFEMTARAFHIPKGLINGDVAGVSEQIDMFLMFAINPLVQLITDEFNGKLFDKEDYLNGNCIKHNTNDIKLFDFSKIAAACDKLFAISSLSADDIREILGMDLINEEWSKKYYVTKNYSEAESLEGVKNELKGGEKYDEENKRTRLS